MFFGVEFMQVREFNRCGRRIGSEGKVIGDEEGFSGGYTGLGFARVVRVIIDYYLHFNSHVQ